MQSPTVPAGGGNINPISLPSGVQDFRSNYPDSFTGNLHRRGIAPMFQAGKDFASAGLGGVVDAASGAKNALGSGMTALWGGTEALENRRRMQMQAQRETEVPTEPLAQNTTQADQTKSQPQQIGGMTPQKGSQPEPQNGEEEQPSPERAKAGAMPDAPFIQNSGRWVNPNALPGGTLTPSELQNMARYQTAMRPIQPMGSGVEARNAYQRALRNQQFNAETGAAGMGAEVTDIINGGRRLQEFGASQRKQGELRQGVDVANAKNANDANIAGARNETEASQTNARVSGELLGQRENIRSMQPLNQARTENYQAGTSQKNQETNRMNDPDYLELQAGIMEMQNPTGAEELRRRAQMLRQQAESELQAAGL